MGDLASWSRLSERNGLLRFIDFNLRGVGQVIFQNNPLTGLLFLLAIAYGAFDAGQINIAFGAIVALIVATTTSMMLDGDKKSLSQGMFGFNGVLVGAAVPTFLANTPSMWVLLVVGAAVSTVVMLAISNVMKTWGAPALTFPFVLTTWFLVLAAYSFGNVGIEGMGPPAFARHPATGSIDVQAIRVDAPLLLDAFLKGPAQVFLINNWVSGILVIFGLAASSLWAAGFALIGSATALLLSLILGASFGSIGNGLYGFSPVLTAVAIGCVFYRPSWRVAVYSLLATIFTVIVQAAMDAALAPIGIPSFTAPFVFVTWLFLLPKAGLKPHPHEPIADGLFGRLGHE